VPQNDLACLRRGHPIHDGDFGIRRARFHRAVRGVSQAAIGIDAAPARMARIPRHRRCELAKFRLLRHAMAGEQGGKRPRRLIPRALQPTRRQETKPSREDVMFRRKPRECRGRLGEPRRATRLKLNIREIEGDSRVGRGEPRGPLNPAQRSARVADGHGLRPGLPCRLGRGDIMLGADRPLTGERGQSPAWTRGCAESAGDTAPSSARSALASSIPWLSACSSHFLASTGSAGPARPLRR